MGHAVFGGTADVYDFLAADDPEFWLPCRQACNIKNSQVRG